MIIVPLAREAPFVVKSVVAPTQSKAGPQSNKVNLSAALIENLNKGAGWAKKDIAIRTPRLTGEAPLAYIHLLLWVRPDSGRLAQR